MIRAMKRQIVLLNDAQQSITRRILPTFSICALAALLWTGCKPDAKVEGDSKAAPARATTVDPAGTYALATVDGKPVPCTLTHEGHTMTIQSGQFVINADGTCVSQMFLEGRNAPIEVKANYTREGAKLAMKWQGAGMTEGTVEDSSFTMNNEGMVLVYRK